MVKNNLIKLIIVNQLRICTKLLTEWTLGHRVQFTKTLWGVALKAKALEILRLKVYLILLRS